MFNAALTQPHSGKRGKLNPLNLSEEQNAKIERLRLEHKKETMPLRDKLKALNTEYKLLVIDEKAAVSTLKSKLEEISKLSIELKLKKASHKRSVRSLLDEKQKTIFDNQYLEKGKKGGGKKKAKALRHKKEPRKKGMKSKDKSYM
jgi:hypothetical protein